MEEPTYKEVVLLFKKKKNSSSGSSGEDQVHGKPDENAIFIQRSVFPICPLLPSASVHLALTLRECVRVSCVVPCVVSCYRFYDIPMKNLQVVFPLQQAGWNWADMVSFLMLLSFSVTLAFKAFFTLAHSTYVSSWRRVRKREREFECERVSYHVVVRARAVVRVVRIIDHLLAVQVHRRGGAGYSGAAVPPLRAVGQPKDRRTAVPVPGAPPHTHPARTRTHRTRACAHDLCGAWVQAKNMAARSLRNNSLNCNKSVLSYIHEAAIEQEIKEALLAYFVIWQWRDGIRKDQLDAAIEHLIKAKYAHASHSLLLVFNLS